jgi:hypothetical protein
VIIPGAGISPSALYLEPGVLRCVLRGGKILFRQAPQEFFSFYSHHEVRATLQIKTEMNVRRERALHTRPREVL